IVRASSGTTSRFISQDKSGQKRPRKPNSRAAPLCASSKERGRHYRLFILRRETECSCSGIKRDTWSSNTRHPHRPPNPIPATQPATSVTPATYSGNPPRTGPPTPQLLQIESPTRCTSTIAAASLSTANPFRFNTYTPLPQLLILNN